MKTGTYRLAHKSSDGVMTMVSFEDDDSLDTVLENVDTFLSSVGFDLSGEILTVVDLDEEEGCECCEEEGECDCCEDDEELCEVDEEE
jgi:hypothetical protein